MPLDGNTTRIHPGFARATKSLDLDYLRRLLIADVYARHRRQQNEEATIFLGIADLDEELEHQADAAGLSTSELATRRADGLWAAAASLGIECDPGGAVLTSAPACCHELQRRFLALLKRDYIYRSTSSNDPEGDRWALRLARFAATHDASLSASGWTDEVVQSQRKTLGKVSGVEVEVSILGVGNLDAFTPHPEKFSQAAFVGIPRSHPVVATLAPGASSRSMLTDAQAMISGVDSLLPVVTVNDVDGPFGESAWLGIPTEDDRDRMLAGSLPPPASFSIKSAKSGTKPRPAARYLVRDIAVSRPASTGVPVPVLTCPSCGQVPLPQDDLPAGGPLWQGTDQSSPCPSCSAAVAPVGEVLTGAFADMSLGAAFFAALPGTTSPRRVFLWDSNDSAGLLRLRIAGHLASATEESAPEETEPFSTVALVGPLRTAEECGAMEIVWDTADLEALVLRIGSDAARYALLSTAAPSTPARWEEHSLRHARRFLDELLAYAQPRLLDAEAISSRTIDPATRLRRRLRAWSATAGEKIADNLDSLAPHRALFEIRLQLRSIQEFEARCSVDGPLKAEDDEAIKVALTALVSNLTSCLPATAETLLAGSQAREPSGATSPG